MTRSWLKSLGGKNYMLRYILIVIGVLCLQTCTIIWPIYYYIGGHTFNFLEKQQNTTLVDTFKFKIYVSKADILLHLTRREAMDYVDVPSAAIVIHNDTIIFEHYNDGWNWDRQSCIFSATKIIISLLYGRPLRRPYKEV